MELDEPAVIPFNGGTFACFKAFTTHWWNCSNPWRNFVIAKLNQATLFHFNYEFLRNTYE